MNALKSIYALATFIGLFILGIATLNYTVDAFCYFRCDGVDVNRKTVNLYYQVAQRVLAHPDAEQIIMGSSRGESVPLKSLEFETGLKTLNLSVGGSELKSKLTYLSFAEKNLNLKRVIWIADYFELLTELSDPRLIYSPALSAEIPATLKGTSGARLLGRVRRVIDRQTVEASIKSLSETEHLQSSRGPGDTTFDECIQIEAKKDGSAETLSKEVDLLYQSYVHSIFSVNENIHAFQELENALRRTKNRGIEIIFVIPPYNPRFSARLKDEYPDIHTRHTEWRRKIQTFANEKVQILDYFLGIPTGKDSPEFWSDGVHFTCKGAHEMILNGKLKSLN